MINEVRPLATSGLPDDLCLDTTDFFELGDLRVVSYNT